MSTVIGFDRDQSLREDRQFVDSEERLARAKERTFPATDAGNGELFAALYGDRVRFDHRRGVWLLWNGHYWTHDCEAAIRNMAVEAARTRYRRAESIPDQKARETEARHAIKAESRDRVEASLYFAASLKPISDRGDEWDRQPHLLGCTNGIVDLRTGTLRNGRPEDKITMCTGFEFDPSARCPRWRRFLEEVFGDKEEDRALRDWLRRAIGYSVTADTSEQIVLILHGAGSNGKSVFCSALRHALGDYSHVMPFSSVERENRRSIPNDVAALVNRRTVFAAETNESTQLNEARIKALTGGDAISARFLHAEWFTFTPVLKIWLSVNHLPKVADLSYGFWRRVRLIPFVNQFKDDKADKHLLDTLRNEAPGILEWIIQGATLWYSRGLGDVPGAVQSATTAYQTESDELGEYVAERLFVHDGISARAGELFKDYTAWADDRGMKRDDRLTSTAFGLRMGQRFQKKSDRNGTTYQGVGIYVKPSQGGSGD